MTGKFGPIYSKFETDETDNATRPSSFGSDVRGAEKCDVAAARH